MFERFFQSVKMFISFIKSWYWTNQIYFRLEEYINRCGILEIEYISLYLNENEQLSMRIQNYKKMTFNYTISIPCNKISWRLLHKKLNAKGYETFPMEFQYCPGYYSEIYPRKMPAK